MKFNEEKAKEIIEEHGLSPVTLRVWRNRGAIPEKYLDNTPRVHLNEVLTDSIIEQAVEKYGQELKRLIESRVFKAGQNDGYYATCLMSLCKEVKYWQETGKLSK